MEFVNLFTSYGELLENGDVRTVKWEEVKQRVQEVLDAHNS